MSGPLERPAPSTVFVDPYTANDADNIAPHETIHVVTSESRRPIRLGHGGNGGSSVLLVRCEGHRGDMAYKACRMHLNEMAFCRAAQRRLAELSLTSSSGGSSAGANASGDRRNDNDAAPAVPPANNSLAQCHQHSPVFDAGLAFLALPERLVTPHSLTPSSLEVLKGETFVAQSRIFDSARNTPAVMMSSASSSSRKPLPPPALPSEGSSAGSCSSPPPQQAFPGSPSLPLIGVIMHRYSATLFHVLHSAATVVASPGRRSNSTAASSQAVTPSKSQSASASSASKPSAVRNATAAAVEWPVSPASPPQRGDSILLPPTTPWQFQPFVARIASAASLDSAVSTPILSARAGGLSPKLLLHNGGSSSATASASPRTDPTPTPATANGTSQGAESNSFVMAGQIDAESEGDISTEEEEEETNELVAERKARIKEIVSRLPATSNAFLIKPKMRRIESIEVITCIMYQVVNGIAALSTLKHTLETTGKSYQGFVHRDLRQDNVLLHKCGAVAICDFELVAHICELPQNAQKEEDEPTGEEDTQLPLSSRPRSWWHRLRPLPTVHDSLSANAKSVGRRILPPAYHPPEGAMSAAIDVWLCGLLALELFTGVAPLVNEIVVNDDFGDGPLLEVNDEDDGSGNGIDWPMIKTHVEMAIRPFAVSRRDDKQKDESASGATNRHVDPLAALPADAREKPALRTAESEVLTASVSDQRHQRRVALMAAFEDFLSCCLQNNPRRRATAVELRDHELFRLYAAQSYCQKGDPRAPLREWLLRHPFGVSKMML